MRGQAVSEGFLTELKKRTDYINGGIAGFLPKEEGKQKTIFEACNYSMYNGGKRIRPILMQSAYILCKGEELSHKSFEEIISSDGYDEDLLLPFIAAIEMIHSSSLVHDDLPCMDNDRLRRGKPSTWAKYGEGMGTLAGDGLMIYAFETASAALKACVSPENKGDEDEKERGGETGDGEANAFGGAFSEEKLLSVIKSIKILSEKTGIYGMIGGQTADVELTGKKPGEDDLDFIYRLKTGALLEASFMIGALLAGADGETVRRLETAAGKLGMAFQIKDDILDETSTEEELGKPIRSDERNEKYTYVTLAGMEKAKAEVERLTAEAKELIARTGDYPFLTELCGYLVSRNN